MPCTVYEYIVKFITAGTYNCSKLQYYVGQTQPSIIESLVCMHATSKEKHVLCRFVHVCTYLFACVFIVYNFSRMLTDL